jgi:hypothetical protein
MTATERILELRKTSKNPMIQNLGINKAELPLGVIEDIKKDFREQEELLAEKKNANK